jgi:amylosucrase
VIGNFDSVPQHLDLRLLQHLGFFQHGYVKDICTGESPPIFNDQLVIPAYGFYWLSE